MKLIKPVLGLVALGVIAYAGYGFLSSESAIDVTTPNITLPENAAEKIREAVLEEQAEASEKFAAFSAETQQGLEDNNESYVVFFHANWCSWCRAREKEIIASLDALPANTRILKADYDKEADLKQAFGVTKQDTFIFVDGSGEPTLKNGSSVATIEEFFVNQNVIPGEERPEGLGNYTDYDPVVVETFKDRKAYAYFFHADWCPSCVAEDKMLTASVADRSLPKNTNIFKVDYDSNQELRKEYGVTGQHAYVFFDKAGEYVETKRGVSKDDLIAYFQ